MNPIEHRLDLRDYALTLWRRRLVVAACLVAAVLAALAATKLQDNAWGAQAGLLVEEGSAGSPAGVGIGPSTRPAAAGGLTTEAAILTSATVRDRVLARYKNASEVSAATGKDSSVIQARVVERSKKQAVKILNAYLDAYFAVRAEEAAAAADELSSQLIAQSSDLQRQIDELTNQVVVRTETTRAGVASLAASRDTKAVTAASKRAAATSAKLASDRASRDADYARDAAAAAVRSNAPDAAALAVAAEQAAAAERSAAATTAAAEAAAEIADAQAVSAGQLATAANASPPDPVVTDLLARQAALRDQHKDFAVQVRDAEVSQALAAPPAKLLGRAIADKEATSPTPFKNLLLGIAAGLALGVAAAFLLEHLDHTVRTRVEVTELIPSLPILGVIPKLGRRARSTRGAEDYRSLRASLQLMGMDRPARTVLVTAPTSGVGTTTTASNLALALARSGQKTLLVDLNLRRPMVHETFGVPNTTGVSSVLGGTLSVARSLRLAADEDNLFLLTSGPPVNGPSDLLAGVHRLAELVPVLNATADVVVMDGPDVLSTGDASVLAAWADVVLLVVGSGSTTREDLELAVDELRRARPPVIGAVLNRARSRGARSAPAVQIESESRGDAVSMQTSTSPA